MKGKEIPQGVIWGVLAVVVLGVIVAIYMMSGGPPAPITDATKVSPERLEDPDPRSTDK